MQHVTLLQLSRSAKSSQLHVFTTASDLGYSAGAYIRLKDDLGNVSCKIVLGKSRVEPRTKQTKNSTRVYRCLHMCKPGCLSFDSVVLWSDFAIVLGYVKNPANGVTLATT